MDDKNKQSLDDLLKNVNSFKKSYAPTNRIKQLKTILQTAKITSANEWKNIAP